MNLAINDSHRKELLRFLLLKTAAVRSGVKPGELLRIQHCYHSRNSEGFKFCLYRRDILEIMQLKFYELRVESESSLILFYHPEQLGRTLKLPENTAILQKYGYPAGAAITVMLKHLQERFAGEKIPHEVGVFIGYPAKDVAGFIEQLPRTPVHRADWAVFGDAGESVARMELYRRIQQAAADLLDTCEDLQTFFRQLAGPDFAGIPVFSRAGEGGKFFDYKVRHI